MTNEPPAIHLIFGEQFKKDIKRLAKKYKKIKQDLEPILEALQGGETLGDRIPNVEAVVYKVRVSNSDAQKGKRGGYRLIYYLVTVDSILLLTIYSKSEQPDISPQQIKDIIKDFEEE